MVVQLCKIVLGLRLILALGWCNIIQFINRYPERSCAPLILPKIGFSSFSGTRKCILPSGVGALQLFISFNAILSKVAYWLGQDVTWPTARFWVSRNDAESLCSIITLLLQCGHLEGPHDTQYNCTFLSASVYTIPHYQSISWPFVNLDTSCIARNSAAEVMSWCKMSLHHDNLPVIRRVLLSP